MVHCLKYFFAVFFLLFLCSETQGQIFRFIFFDPELEATLTTHKIPSDKYVNSFGDLTNESYEVKNKILTEEDLVKRYYYKNDILIAQRNYTIEGDLTSDGSGVAIYEYQYDANKNLTEIQYFDEEKESTQVAFAGPAKIRYEYDERNNRVKALYFDRYDQLLGLGTAVILYTYDDQNRLVLEKQFDAQEELLTTFAPIIKYSYDDKNRIVKQTFLNKDLQEVTRLMDDDEGDVAFITFEYSNNRLSAKHYYNKEGVLLGSEDDLY